MRPADGHGLNWKAGLRRHDFTYVEDVAERLLRLGLASSSGAPIVKRATGRLTAARSFVETAVILGIRPGGLRCSTVPGRPEEIEHDPVSLDRVRRLIGWTLPIADPRESAGPWKAACLRKRRPLLMATETLGARSDPELSLVMPCFNEEAIVSHTIAKLLDAFAKAGCRVEIVAVDNGSSDRTGEIIRAWSARHAAVMHHRVDENQGYGNGVLAGLPLATGAWVGIIPADGQVDAEDVVRLFEVVRTGDSWALAKARRCFRLDGMLRKFVSVGYNLMFRMLWPTVGSIDINGLPKIMPRKCIAAMGLKSKGWFLDPEIMIKSHALGLRVIEFNVFARLRGGGVSHVKAGTCWEFFTSLMRYRFRSGWKREVALDHAAAESPTITAKV